MNDTQPNSSTVWIVALIGVLSGFLSALPILLVKYNILNEFDSGAFLTSNSLTNVSLEPLFPGFVFGFALLSLFPLALRRAPSAPRRYHAGGMLHLYIFYR